MGGNGCDGCYYGWEMQPMIDLEKMGAAATDIKTAYAAGADYARNGATDANCHFVLFSSREMTAEWERGRDEEWAAQNANTPEADHAD